MRPTIIVVLLQEQRCKGAHSDSDGGKDLWLLDLIQTLQSAPVILNTRQFGLPAANKVALVSLSAFRRPTGLVSKTRKRALAAHLES